MTEESTKIEMIEQDDEVEVINERQNLLSQSKKVVKSKSAKVSCCKAIVITVAVIIFIAILIQIWADYGSYLETHSLPPGIHSMSSHCVEPLLCIVNVHLDPEYGEHQIQFLPISFGRHIRHCH